MSKTKTTLILLMVFSLSGCTYVNQMMNKTPAGTPTISAQSGQVVLATPTIEETTPTPTHSPSPFYMDTQIAADAKSNQEQMIAADKRLEAAHIEQTNIADEKTLVTRKETVEQGIMIATGTQLAIVSTNDQANREFQKIVPTLMVAGTQATYTGYRAASEIALNWLMGIGVVLVAVVLLIAMTTSRKVPAKVVEGKSTTYTQDDLVSALENTKKFAAVNKNGFGLHLSPPGDQNHFMGFLLAVTSGRKGFAITEWYGADSPYTRDSYKLVYNWLWLHKLIELPPGGKIRFTVEGQGWAERWIERHLITSPSAVDEPISTELPSDNSQHPETQGAEGGGEVELHEDAEPEPAPEPLPELPVSVKE
jgi:hypothetical protein